MRRRHLPVTLCTFVILLCSAVKYKVTEEDLILLSGDHDVPHCFSRNLESVTCYWGAEELLTDAEELLTDADARREDAPYRFHYSYDKLVFIPHRESEKDCELSVQTGPGRRTLYVCEDDEVVLFNDLNVCVKDKMTNQTLRSRTFELELFAILPPPQDIKVVWEESTERFRVTWKPPDMDMNFMFKYEVQFWSTEEQHESVIAEEMKEVLLPHLRPIQLYHLRVRTSWKAEKPSLWGPWSGAVTFNGLEFAENIGLHCFTSDLSQVCCKWDEKMDASFLQVHYRYGQESTSTWQPCEDSAHPRDCHCVFPSRNDRSMSVTLKVTFVDGKEDLYYHKPFWINHVVLPPAPELHIHRLPGNKLALNWTSPIPGLGKHLIYQIRFSIDNEKSWTTLQVPSGVNSKLMSMVSDTSYTLQIRASPNQKEIQGSWSQWSARVSTKSPSSIAWVTPVIIISILIFLAAVLCLPCVFPSLYRKLKDKLWPPLPNLHRVLDTFLAEIQKQYQPDSTPYQKPLEEAAQPSRLEILCELTLTSEGQQVSRDYVQLAPLSYQNEEYWPNLEPLEVNPDLSANSQPPSGLTNKTYLPTVWSSL
ncbi:thrombopoietin receptor isoform X1 [Bufo bufo]|uniref:thrombopoietin receptor isoform X1 n=1 Tax=Bufo bufo TaxID=8384 RepID=UPI001ABE59FA|nr:thrombopoietin receptor isoform X1 [Bufo bufo]